MKVRLVKDNGNVQILCADGTFNNASQSLLVQLFTHFDDPGIFSNFDNRWDQNYLDMSEYPGETVAYITDDNRLLVVDPWIMSMAMTPPEPNLAQGNLITSQEYAKKNDRSKETILALLRNGRIFGAVKIGRQWFIPEDTPYPIEIVNRRPTAGRTPRK